ncbi:MAG: hypothetical protein U1D30_08350 [Planctomycetota bacterium]
MNHATATAGFAPKRSTGVMRILLSAFLVAVTGAGETAAQGPKRDITSIRVGFQGRFKPGFWVPIAIEITGEGPALRGTLELNTPDSDGIDTSLVQEVFVNVNERTTIHHFIKLGSPMSEIDVQLRDENGEVVAGRRLELANNLEADSLQGDQRFILAQNAPSGIGEAVAGNSVVAESVVVVQNQNPRDMPTQWFAYGAVNSVVLSTRDVTFFDTFDALRASALQTWVRQGGHLVVSVANNWQVVQSSFLQPMLPAKLTGVASVRVPDALETYANAKERFDAGEGGLPVAQLAEVRGRIDVESAGKPIVVTGTYGLGKVTLLAFDADAVPFSRWPGRQDFWIKLLEFPRATGDASQQRNQQYAYYGVNEMGSVLNSRLEDFPEVTVVPFGWVALLIFGYILLIGPIDYFVLKKVFGRLELTWITFPTIVVGVSLAAYFAAHWLKGDELRVNQVQFVDIDVPSETLRGNAFTAIFSPRIARYAIAYTPGLGAEGTWRISAWGGSPPIVSGPGWGCPSRRTEACTAREASLCSSAAGYSYVGPEASGAGERPHPGLVRQANFRTGGWQKQAAWSRPISAKEILIAGTITNKLKHRLYNLLVLHGDFVYVADALDANATLDLESIKPRTVRDYFGTRTLDVSKYRYGYAVVEENASSERLTLAEGLLFSRLAKKTTESFPNHYLHDLDLSDRLDLGKVVVFASVDAPGGRFWLDAPPTTEGEPPAIDGKIRSETYLRLFLDLKKDHP